MQILSNKDSLIIQDDGSNEIADLISFNNANKEVSLYHCKGLSANEDSPGARLADFNVVVAQAVSSTYWVYNQKLLTEINN